MKIAIIGAGAIGGYFGAHMTRAGLDVTFVDAWPDHVEQVRRHGFRVDGFSADRPVVVPARIRHVGEVQSFVREAPFDIAFIAVKSYDTRWASELILPHLAPDGVVVSLQNAINEPAIASIVGDERTYGCAIAALACELTGPGHVRRLSETGKVSIGALRNGDPRRLQQIAEAISTGEHSEVVANLMDMKWSKLVVNAMRNGLSAMTGMTGLERDSHPTTIALGMRLGAQTVRVGRALGRQLVDTGFNFDTLVATETGDAGAIDAIRRRMAEIAAGRSAEQRPSMGQDIAKGRRTETDAINGFIASVGHELGIDTTPHRRVHETIMRIERGEITPSPALAEGIL